MKKLLAGLAAFLCLSATAAESPSNACLTCHGGAAGPAIRRPSSHAYGIDYAAARRDARKALRAPDTPSGFGSTVAADLLVNGRVECTSCHVEHEVASEIEFRLRHSVPSLCIGCHDPARL